MKISLFLDEDVHPTLAPVLRDIGFDVISTVETKSDPTTPPIKCQADVYSA